MLSNFPSEQYTPKEDDALNVLIKLLNEEQDGYALVHNLKIRAIPGNTMVRITVEIGEVKFVYIGRDYLFETVQIAQILREDQREDFEIR